MKLTYLLFQEWPHRHSVRVLGYAFASPCNVLKDKLSLRKLPSRSLSCSFRLIKMPLHCAPMPLWLSSVWNLLHTL